MRPGVFQSFTYRFRWLPDASALRRRIRLRDTSIGERWINSTESDETIGFGVKVPPAGVDVAGVVDGERTEGLRTGLQAVNDSRISPNYRFRFIPIRSIWSC